jgi:hypothetical protein
LTTCFSFRETQSQDGGERRVPLEISTSTPSSSEVFEVINMLNRDTLREASQSSNLPVVHDPANHVGKQLSDDDKVILLTHVWKPPSETFQFPVTSGRRFNLSWLAVRPWLCYSVINDSVFCRSCMCFCSASESPFVASGFKNWKKALGKAGYFDKHQNSESHKAADWKRQLCFFKPVSLGQTFMQE